MNDVVVSGDGVRDAHGNEGGDCQRADDDPRTFRDRATHGSPPGHTTQESIGAESSGTTSRAQTFRKTRNLGELGPSSIMEVATGNRAIVAPTRRADESACRPGSVTGTLRSQRATIHLRLPLPTA